MNPEIISTSLDKNFAIESLSKQLLPAKRAIYAIFAVKNGLPVNCRFIGETSDFSSCVISHYENSVSNPLLFEFLHSIKLKVLQYVLLQDDDDDLQNRLFQEWVAKHNPMYNSGTEINSLIKKLESLNIKLGRKGNKITIANHNNALSREDIATIERSKSTLLQVLENDDVNSIDSIEDQAYYSLSHKQKGKCYLYRLLKKCTNTNLQYEINRFNLSAVYHFTSLDTNAFKEALSLVVTSNQGLRTTFQEVGSDQVQVIKEEKDLDYFSYRVRKNLFNISELQDELKEEMGATMEFKSGPLFKTTIYETANAYTILIVMNHVISDGRSMTTVLEQLTETYSALVRNEAPNFKQLLQLKDFTAWEERVYGGQDGIRRSIFWKDKMSNAPTFPFSKYFKLPIFENGSSYALTLRKELSQNFRDLKETEIKSFLGTYHRGTSYPGAVYSTTLNHEELQAINHLAKSATATNFMVILTSIQLLHYLITSNPDIVVGYEVSNRNQLGSENIVGWLSGSMLSRIRLATNTNINVLIRKNLAEETSNYLKNHYPFDRILYELDLSLDAFGTFYLNYQQKTNSEHTLQHFDLHLRQDEAPCYFHIDFSIYEFVNGLQIDCRFRKDLFENKFIEEILVKWKSILLDMTSRPNAIVSDFQLLSTHE